MDAGKEKEKRKKRREEKKRRKKEGGHGTLGEKNACPRHHSTCLIALAPFSRRC
jgi:hypothetical protein